MTVLPVGDRWFTRQAVGDDVTLLAEQFTDPLIRCNIWHVRGRDRDLVIDTGLGVASLRQELESVTERSVVAVATHGHFDHIGGMYEFDERVGHVGDVAAERALTSSPLVAAGYSVELQRVFTAAGYPIADPLLHALPVAGFDPGAFRVLFSGDTVYDGGLLDSLPGSDVEQYGHSMRRLRDLPVRVVHGGHEPSFGRPRLVALIDGYLRSAGAVGMAR